MSKAKTSEVITTAKPHTVKKFELIERYVDEWARKILGFNGAHGYSGSQGIIYIDCMSNSGLYYDIDKNLIEGTAIRVAKRLNGIIPNYPGKKAILIFNDLEKSRIQCLQKEVEKASLNNVQVLYYNQDCNDFLKRLQLPLNSSQYNTLLLYDPYRASIDWDAITPYLNRWGEVIINHMVHDTTRGAALAKNADVVSRYQETYQKDITTIIEAGNDKEQLNNIILSIINRRVELSTSKYYIASFPFFNRSNGLIYNLIHCCSNIEGLKLFKKVAWKTFGDKSSLKDTHGTETQLTLDFYGNGTLNTDDECYYVQDIAKYIWEKYSALGVADLQTIYHDLDEHPIFPSDGYKREIKAELKRLYGVTFKDNKQAVFPYKQGVNV